MAEVVLFNHTQATVLIKHGWALQTHDSDAYGDARDCNHTCLRGAATTFALWLRHLSRREANRMSMEGWRLQGIWSDEIDKTGLNQALGNGSAHLLFAQIVSRLQDV